MISTESFSREWISQKSIELDYKDKLLLEKVIRAFSLLEMLVDAGAPIVFKGGSSLLLILKDSLNRLSIDVDVICPPGGKSAMAGLMNSVMVYCESRASYISGITTSSRLQ